MHKAQKSLVQFFNTCYKFIIKNKFFLNIHMKILYCDNNRMTIVI